MVVRRAPQWARPPLRTGLLAAAVAVLLLVPGLAGTAREAAPDNPSVQPADERVSLGLALLVVTVAAGVWGLRRRRRQAAASQTSATDAAGTKRSSPLL